MSLLSSFLLVLIFSVGIFADNPLLIPESKQDDGGYWMGRHAGLLKTAQENTENHIVWIGDSIISLMSSSDLWKQKISTLHCLNFGIGGDTIQNILWRMTNGEFDFKVKMNIAVVFGGTNNVRGNEIDDIVEGIVNLVNVAKEKLGSEVAIVIPTLLPRGEFPNELRDKIVEINAKVMATYPDDPTDNVYVVHIGENVINDDGTISADDMGDFAHPTNQGYTKIFTPVYDKLVEIVNSQT